MLRSLDGLAPRSLRTRPLRAGLTAFGVVLGVGMVFAVLLLVGTIRHTFDDLISSAYGDTDYIVDPRAGGLLPADAPDKAAHVPGVAEVAPWVGGLFIRLDENGKPIRGGKGKMWVAAFNPQGPDPMDMRFVEGRPMQVGPELVVERNWADDRGVEVGDAIGVATPGGRAKLRVVGIFEFSSGLSFGGQGLAAMPVDAGRPLMNAENGWNQLTIRVENRDEADAAGAGLRRALGSGVQVREPSEVSEDVNEQMSAMNVVLYFFSGIALFVGAFVILNGFNMTVLQRMREFGTLRTLGVDRRTIVRIVLLEALLLAVVGIAFGLLVGLGLATGLIAMMRALEFPVGDLELTSGAAVAAAVTGVAATLAGAAWPAARAGRIPPIRAVLGAGAIARQPRTARALLGLALFVPGLLLGGQLWFGEDSGEGASALLAVLCTMLMFVGMAIAAPLYVMPLVRLLSLPLRRLFPAEGRLASDSARSNPARTAATAAALTIGLSVVIVNSGIASSFLGTIERQLDAAMARDLTVQPVGAGLEDGGGQTIPPEVRRQIKAMPQASVVTPVRASYVKLPGATKSHENGLAIAYSAAEYAEVDRTPIAGATREEALDGLAHGGIVIGRTYAENAGLGVGDRVLLRGPSRTRRVRVVGVLDAMSEWNGQVMHMSLDTIRDVYGVTGDAALAVKARSEQDRAALATGVDRLLDRSYPELEALSTADVKESIGKQIDQQFGLFNAIVYVAVLVSLLGVINTLAMSVLERTRELGVLRALGSSRWQVRVTMLHESLLITIAGAIAGLGLGTLISFWWVNGLDNLLPGVSFEFPLVSALTVAIAAVVLGVIAAVLPARRAARLKVVEALAYE